jgi:hypothetical protein
MRIDETVAFRLLSLAVAAVIFIELGGLATRSIRSLAMKDTDASTHIPFKSAILALATATAAAIFAAGMMLLSAAPTAQATPQFAQQTGLPCTRCHVKPTGGMPLKPFGKRFMANGNKLPKKK